MRTGRKGSFVGDGMLANLPALFLCVIDEKRSSCVADHVPGGNVSREPSPTRSCFVALSAIEYAGPWEGSRVRILKTRWFARFARKAGISDKMLADAVREMEKGLIDGKIGRGLIKKRLARAGEGKRGGYRTIIVYRAESRSVFVYGFPKSAKADLSPIERDVYQKLAHIYLGFSDADMAKALKEGEVEEVNDDDDEEISD